MPAAPEPARHVRAESMPDTVSDVILFNKPYAVLSQFTDREGRRTLAGDHRGAGLWPGRPPRLRLPEGLLVLCADGTLQARIAAPRFKLAKTYLVQVEGQISPAAIERLRRGVQLKDGLTRPASAEAIDPPQLWPRDPPIRFRARIPTSWIQLGLHRRAQPPGA